MVTGVQTCALPISSQTAALVCRGTAGAAADRPGASRAGAARQHQGGVCKVAFMLEAPVYRPLSLIIRNFGSLTREDGFVKESLDECQGRLEMSCS